MTDIFKLNLRDVAKGLVVAVLSGIFLPLAAIVQSTGFNIATANWHEIGVLAINGAIVGFFSYIVKNFLSTSDGKVLGAIG